ncbi:hypothetical protein [Gordonia desulfuricans]|uniref:hypothetical protein n=1 Tax=Gordonia desulfuricans TaxID=89051 RepID=UPI00073F6BE2|nr:hypothetical protein [Gordonia desulfuricans]
MTHPEPAPRHGRGTVWVLGVVAFGLVAALTVAIVYLVTRGDDTGRAASSATTVTVSQGGSDGRKASTDTSPASASPVPAPTPAPTQTVTETATAAVPTGSVAAEGSPCLESEARSFGTAADGTSLVCVFLGADAGHRWVRHAEDDDSVHTIGEPCDSSVDRVSRDRQGRAILCGGTTWTAGP